MKKRILSLICAGIIAVTATPVVAASAAETDSISVSSANRGPSDRVYIGSGYVKPNTTAFSQPIYQPRYQVGPVTSINVKCALYYYGNASRGSNWVYVRCKVNNNSKYGFYFVEKSQIQLVSGQW